jgi:N-acetylneuraminic acid mutarotase
MYRPQSLIVGLLTLAACGESPTVPSLALASNSWTPRAAYPSIFGAYGTSAGVFPNAAGKSIVYALGGTDGEGGSGVAVTAYNVATNTWTSKGPEPRIYVFNTNGVGRIGNNLYFSGGEQFAGGGFTSMYAELWAYNPVTNRLVQKAPAPKATAQGVTGVIGSMLYVLPGACSGDLYPNPRYCETEAFRGLFRYNPATNKWATKRPAPNYHREGAGGVINGKFYVAGGVNNVRALDRYDPATNTWKTLAPLPVGGRARGAVLQGKLFVIVEELVSGGAELKMHAFSYNPANNTWSSKAPPKFRHDAVVAVRVNGRPSLLAIAGVQATSGGSTPNVSELYTP